MMHIFLQRTYFNDRVCARRGLSKSFVTRRVIYLAKGKKYGRGGMRKEVV